MEVLSVSTPQEFLELTSGFRAAEPYLTNVIGSIAVGVVSGREYESCHWWIAREGSEIAGIAVRTAPHNLVLSPMEDAALAALAASVTKTFPHLPGVSGAPAHSAAFERLLRPAESKVTMQDVVYIMRDFTPATAPGASRRTNASDADMLLEWSQLFAKDAGIPIFKAAAAVDRLLAAGWIWEVDGEPTAMAGHAFLVGEPGSVVGRVGPVFTPMQHRRRSYGAAVTSAVVEHLQGVCDHIMLYADALNPTSNGVYQRLGFVEYAQLLEVEFTYT